MRKLLFNPLLIGTFLVLSFSSCEKDDGSIDEDISSYRISKISYERGAYSNLIQYLADISYENEKVATITIKENLDSDTSYYKFGYDVNTIYRSYYNINKELKSKQTCEFENDKLLFWMLEEDYTDQLEPVEKINYSYNGDLLESFLTYDYLHDIWRSYMEGNYSYNNDLLKEYKLYFNWNEGAPEEFAVENSYTYKDNDVTFIERIDFADDQWSDDEIYHYHFTYAESKVVKIENYYIDDQNIDSTLYELFEFSYDLEGRLQSTSYEDFNYNTKSEWTYEYEKGNGNIIFDKDKFVWEIIDWHQLKFKETLINDFFTVLPK